MQLPWMVAKYGSMKMCESLLWLRLLDKNLKVHQVKFAETKGLWLSHLTTAAAAFEKKSWEEINGSSDKIMRTNQT